MQATFVGAFLLLLLQSPFSCNAGGHDPEQAPRYHVNLDLPPEERWNQVVADFEDEIKVLSQVVQHIFPVQIVDELLEKVFPKINNALSYPYA